MSELARRAQIQIGSITVDGFMLADGTYRMSQTQAGDCVSMSRRNVSEFLRSKAIKSLLGEGFAGSIFDEEIAIQPETGDRGQTRFRAVPLEVVVAYWQWQSFRGNKEALKLCVAMSLETLERRFDNAFGVSRSEAEYNQQLAQRLQEIEAQLKEQTKQFKLLEFEYTKDDITRERYEELKRFVRGLGFDEWGMPLPEDEQ